MMRRVITKKEVFIVIIAIIGIAFFLFIKKQKPQADIGISFEKNFGVVIKENSNLDKIEDLNIKYSIFDHPLEWSAYDNNPATCFSNINSITSLGSVTNKSIIKLSTGTGWSKVENSNDLYSADKMSMPKIDNIDQYINFVKDSFINIGTNTPYISLAGAIDDPDISQITGDNWLTIYNKLGSNFERNNKNLIPGVVDINSLVLFRVFDLYQSGNETLGYQLASNVFQKTDDLYFYNLINGTNQQSFFTKITTDNKSKFIIDVISKVFSLSNRNKFQSVIINNNNIYDDYVTYKTAINESFKIINPQNQDEKEIIFINSNGNNANEVMSENSLATQMVKNISAIASKNSSRNIIWNLLKDMPSGSNVDKKNGLIDENGREKPIYFAFRNLNSFLANKKFDSIIKENNDSVIYKFTGSDEDVWIGWSNINESFSIATNANNLKKADLLQENSRNSSQTLIKNGYLYNIQLSSDPVVVFGDKNTGGALTANISASPTEIRSGQSVSIAWSSAGAGNTSIKICQNIQLENCSDAFGAIAQSGARIINITQTTTYLIGITDGINTVSDSVTITVLPEVTTTPTTNNTTTTKVSPPPPPPPPNITTTTYNTTTTSQQNTTVTVPPPPPPPGETTTTSVIILTTSSSSTTTTTNPKSTTTIKQTSTTKVNTITTTSPDIIIIGSTNPNQSTTTTQSTTITSTIPIHQIDNEDLNKTDVFLDSFEIENPSKSNSDTSPNTLTRLVGTGKQRTINIFIIVSGILVISTTIILITKKYRVN